MPLPPPLAAAVFPAAVRGVLERLRDAGHRSWLVGGTVRDLLLGRNGAGADFDIATPATPKQVTALFPRVIPTGIDHGTVTVLVESRLKVEVTTFRGEGAYADGRRPTSVTFHTDLDADLARRDFTINAMAFDPLAGELADPFGGQADLAGRLIRAVGDPVARFGEDGLRALRAVRFAGELGFALDGATQRAIRGALPVVRRVSLERVAEELTRLAVSPHVEAAVRLLGETGLIEVVLPPLATATAERLVHLAAVAARVGGTREVPALRLAALLHDLPPAEVEPLLAGLRMSRRVSIEAAALVARHRCLAAGAPGDPATPAAVRRWLAEAGAERSGQLLQLRRAEVECLPAASQAGAREEAERLAAAIARELASGAPLSTAALAIDGQGLMALLGCGPGPHVGEGLRALLGVALEDPSVNSRDRLAAAARAWWAARASR